MSPKKPSESEIARKAFEIWEAEGRPEGRDVANWHQAERDVTEPVLEPIPDVAPAVEAEPPAPAKPARARKPKAAAAKPEDAAPTAKAPRRRKAATPEA